MKAAGTVLIILAVCAPCTPSRAADAEPEADLRGFGLQETVRSRAEDVVGILNGVDYEVWDPSADPLIVQQYAPDDLAGKARCKADLLAAFGLGGSPDLPLVGVTSRLVWQKGFDVVAGA